MYLMYLPCLICLLALWREGYCSPTIAPPEANVLTSEPPTAATPLDLSSKYVVFQEQKTWDEAKNFCDENGMTLAYIMTYEEQKAVRDYITEHNWLPKDEQSGYWLGARAKDKIWRWDFNQENPRNEHFMAGWHWYKPDYQVNGNGEVEECMELQYINASEFTKSLAWNDVWCNEKRAFICQVIDSSDLGNVKKPKQSDDKADLKKMVVIDSSDLGNVKKPKESVDEADLKKMFVNLSQTVEALQKQISMIAKKI